MERLRVHYWSKDGEPKEAVVEAEDGQAAVDSIDDIGRLGYVESAPEAETPKAETPRRRSRKTTKEG